MAHLEGQPKAQKNLNQDLVNVIKITQEEKDESTEVLYLFTKHMKCTVVLIIHLSICSLMMAYILYWSVELTRISYYRGFGPVE